MKLVVLLLLAVFACRLITGKWPWDLRRALPSPHEKQARALLGVERSASHADIIEAHRRLVSLVHPDRGGTNEAVHEANAARDLLLGTLQKKPMDP